MSQEHLINSSKKTQELGQGLAEKILKNKPKKKALVIGLKGELGTGKTTFLQGFAKGLGIKEKILSPTFVIFKKFEIPKNKSFHWFYHIDCYRIKKEKELLDLGFKEIISDAQNIVVIEWADQISKIMPKNSIWIDFYFISEDKRKIKF